MVLHSETQSTGKHVTDLVPRLMGQHLLCGAGSELREVGLEGEGGEVAQAAFPERGKQVVI